MGIRLYGPLWLSDCMGHYGYQTMAPVGNRLYGSLWVSDSIDLYGYQTVWAPMGIRLYGPQRKNPVSQLLFRLTAILAVNLASYFFSYMCCSGTFVPVSVSGCDCFF